MYKYTPDSSWKATCFRGLRANKRWEFLEKDQLLSGEEVAVLRDSFYECLKQPALPMPDLRREVTYATIFQDILGQEIFNPDYNSLS